MGARVRWFEGNWYIFINHKNRRKAKKIGPSPEDEKRAREAARLIEAKLRLGDLGVLEPAVMTLKDYAEQWLDGYVAMNLKQSTQELYRRAMEQHWIPALGTTPLGELTKLQIRAIVAKKMRQGLEHNSVRALLIALQSCLGMAEEEEVLAKNPLKNWGKWLIKSEGQPTKIKEIFTDAEVKCLLAEAERCGIRTYAMVMLLARTGMRIGEASALGVQDIDFEAREIWVRRTWGSRKKTPEWGQFNTPKNGKERRVDMSRQLAAVLQEYICTLHGDWLLPGQDGTPMRPSSFLHNLWRPLFKDGAVLYLNPHILRHTYASLLIFRGESLAYVKEQLGHSSIRITVDTYSHLIPGSDKRAVDGLDDLIIRKPAASENPTTVPQLAIVGRSRVHGHR